MKHLIITDDAESASSIITAFGKVEVIKFGDCVKATGSLIWFRLDPFSPPKPQLEWLTKNYKHEKFVVLASIPEVTEAMLCFTSGAKAYVNIHAGPKTIKQVAEVVKEGGVWIGENLMQFFIATVSQSPAIGFEGEPTNVRALLTDREWEVAEVVAGGAPNKVVARQLNISERTVKAHIASIFEKLGINDRLKLAILIKNDV